MNDSYLRECDVTVIAATNGKYVVLGQTSFHPKEAGQLQDVSETMRKNDFSE